jgi:hypothetical protein
LHHHIQYVPCLFLLGNDGRGLEAWLARPVDQFGLGRTILSNSQCETPGVPYNETTFTAGVIADRYGMY